MSRAAELREQFLKMRGASPLPEVPPFGVRLALIHPTEESKPKAASRYIDPGKFEERRTELLYALAELPGWSVVLEDEQSLNQGVGTIRHECGAEVFGWWKAQGGKGDRASLNAGDVKASVDGYRFEPKIETRSITVSLDREIESLKTDVQRRLLDPLVEAYPEAKQRADEYDETHIEADALAYELAEIAEGREPGTEVPIGTWQEDRHQHRRAEHERSSGGCRFRVNPSRSGLSVDILRAALTPDQARRIVAIIGEGGES